MHKTGGNLMKEKTEEDLYRNQERENWPPYTYRDYPDITPENYRSFLSFLRTENTRHLEMELQAWISFCDSKCTFCYFPNEPFHKERIEEYLLALKKELKMYAETRYIRSSEFDEVVLGGGTPTVLSSEQIVDLLSYCQKTFNVTEDPMIKVAASTHNVDKEKFKAVVDYAASVHARCAQMDIGVQTFDDSIRKMFNMQDSAVEAERMIKTARRLGLYVCIDLMFNLPGQTMEGFREDIKRALKLDVEGIDYYALSVVSGTPLAKQIQRGKIPPMGGSDLEKRMYLEAYEMFEEAGYTPTGHSRFARVAEWIDERCCVGWPWTGQLTAGAGAFMGYFERYSYVNIEPASAYINAVNRGMIPIAKLSISSEEEEMRKVMMRLYIRQPVDKQKFQQQFGRLPEETFPRAISKLEKKGLIKVDNQEIRLTKKGDVWRYNIAWEFGPRKKP
jgi:coproporphyrinogen III oxidase-like Fe-S oxidoreductase